MRFRYSRWDGTQDPFGPDVSRRPTSSSSWRRDPHGRQRRRTPSSGCCGEACRAGSRGIGCLEAASASASRARAGDARPRRAAGARSAERLDEILERERTELTFRDDDDARMRESFLDALPPDAPGQVAELREYRFSDAGAQQMFDALMQELREQVMGAHFRQMAEGMQSLTPEDIARFKDMLAELNGLIEMRDRARTRRPPSRTSCPATGPVPRHPEDPGRTARNMARRMAAMSRFMASLSPEQREELGAVAEQVMQDMDLAFEVDRLRANLANAFPDMGWGEGSGQGEGSGGRRADVGRRRRHGTSARLRGPRSFDARRLRGRHARRRR